MLPKDIRKQDSEDETGKGGKTGNAEFRDFLAPDEKKRLSIVHRETHEFLVKKQKQLSEERKAIKEGKVTLQAFHAGKGSGMNSGYKPQPILQNKAQFSGTDNQVSLLPTENTAETNEENRQELEQKYQLRHQPEAAPRFNPKPQFNG